MQISLSDRLSELLEDKDITIFAFAKQIDVSFSIASQWIRENTPVKLSNLLKIASYFNCSVDFICGRSEELGTFSNSQPTFPKRFVTLMQESGQTNTKVFNSLGMNRHALYDWQKGSIPLSTSLIAIADYFDCSIDYLIGIED